MAGPCSASATVRMLTRYKAWANGGCWWITSNFGGYANEPYVGAAVRCLSRDQRPVN